MEQMHLVNDEQPYDLCQRDVTRTLTRHNVPLLWRRHQHLDKKGMKPDFEKLILNTVTKLCPGEGYIALYAIPNQFLLNKLLAT
jgi:hypothetical protein